ncbi:MAG: ABC transporter ATP-binding protein/permease [Lachnospiraceae bacterium]|nr:ABC transporter ATP-binding protein/permease [Lachnospiraceae bacterium]
MAEQTKHEQKSANSVVFKTLRYFIPIAWKNYKGFFIFSAIHIILDAAYPFVAIMMTPLILDELLGDRDITKLLLYVTVIVVVGSIISLLAAIASVTMEKYKEKMDNYFTEQISLRVMELDFQLTEDKEALDQIEKARTGMSWYSDGVYGICTQLFNALSDSLKIIGVVALILLHAPLLFAVTAILILVVIFLSKRQNAIEIESFRRLSKSNRIFGYLSWELMNFRYGKDIRLYAAQDMMVGKWNSYVDESLNNWKWQADQSLPLNNINAVCSAINDFFTYLYLGFLVISGNITIGIFSQMLAASSRLQTSTQGLIRNVKDLVKRTNYAYEYVKFMDYPAAIEKGTLHIPDKPHTIEFRNVSFSYPNTDVQVLNGVNIILHPGEHLSVVGLNGAGKTTFIKLLCRLYDATEGEILLDGVNIKEYDYQEYMALFSPIFQDFNLFSFSIKDNILLDSPDFDSTAQTALHDLIRQVGLQSRISSLEKGIDTMLFKSFDENGIEPSGGEQQKIAIARALHKKAPVVILDEPTAALDPVAEYDIYRQFNTLVGKKTAIYISHRLSSCKFCDRIAVFSDGCIKEYGTHDELLAAKNGIYSAMFAAQAHYYN